MVQAFLCIVLSGVTSGSCQFSTADCIRFFLQGAFALRLKEEIISAGFCFVC